MKTPVLIIYDISSDKVRNRFSKELLAYGIRTQKSLFEAEVTDGQLNQLKNLVDKYVYLNDEDTISMYIMEPDNYAKTIRIGDVRYLEVDDFII